MAFERFIDNKYNIELLNKCKNFREREHDIPPNRILGYVIVIPVVVIACLIYLGITTLEAYSGDNFEMTDTTLLVFVVISILCTAMAILFVVIIKKIRAIVLGTEFHNFLLADTINAQNDFYIIVSTDLKQMYYDANAAKLLPNKGSKKPDYVDILFSYDGLKKEDSKKLKGAVKKGKAVEVTLTIGGKGKSSKKMPLQSIPLPRTNGMVNVLCGRYK